jgi:hypothetical protein
MGGLGDANNGEGKKDIISGASTKVTKINGDALKNNNNGSGSSSSATATKKKGRSNSNGVNKDHAYIDHVIPAAFVAETNLPTDVGQFRLRAYRTKQGSNEYTGTEPCVIYSTAKSPFGHDGELREDVAVRIHDQCLTSEVFRSQRYVLLSRYWKNIQGT